MRMQNEELVVTYKGENKDHCDGTNGSGLKHGAIAIEITLDSRQWKEGTGETCSYFFRTGLPGPKEIKKDI